MSEKKFDNIDRKRVIRVVEDYFKVKLSKIGRRSKWLQDDVGRNYWILGGYGEWHGIPEDMMNAEIEASTEGVLVVAIRKKNSMDIFAGGVDELVTGKAQLYRASKTTGDYQFTYETKGNHLILKQLPIFSLEKINSLSYEIEEKKKDIAVNEVKKLLDGMSKEERTQLLQSIDEKKP